jgi:hypothetical protein
MTESLAKIISHFPGASNRARCTAHIVNLVSKIILRQFDARKKKKTPKKKSGNANDNANEEPTNTTEIPELDDEAITSLAEGLDREEQEVTDDEEDEMSENIAADLEEIEEAMKEEILDVAKKVKPIKRVLFKVRGFIIILTHILILLIYIALFLLSASETRLCNQTVNNDPPPSMERNLGRTCCRCRHYRPKTIVGSNYASGCFNTLEFNV